MKVRESVEQVLRLFGYHPYRAQLPETVDQFSLVEQAAGYYQIEHSAAQTAYDRYASFSREQGYAGLLGERKTLSFEEAYLLFMAAARTRPQTVLEIGTQYGKSTRRILDLLKLLGLDSRVICFDIADERQFVGREEVELKLGDITGQACQVLETYTPGLIYLDAHPYALLRDVIEGFLAWSAGRQSILAIHDCSPVLYNPKMKISKDDPAAIGSRTGHWERHVLSEVFGLPNEQLEDIRLPHHRLRIFGTPHGLALLAPLSVLQEKGIGSG